MRSRLRWGLVLAGLAVACIALAVVAIGAGLLVTLPQTDRITEENFDQIRNGMTRAQVEAILGPPGDYTTGPVKIVFISGTSAVSQDLWLSDNLAINVWCNSSDQVFDTCCNDVVLIKQTTLERVHWKLKRQWRRWFP
jgi:SmpA / OmlA family